MALIYRQAALDKFKPWLEVKGYSEGELNMLRAVIYELENLPDAGQEIIHCEKCLYKEICSWKREGAKFCSFGERGETE